MLAQAMLVIASATAKRADAAGFNNATGGRSPIAIASPVKPCKLVVVTAASATGTCQRPTIWSRATIPVIERSPMVIKNDLDATVGFFNTRKIASFKSTFAASKSLPVRSIVSYERCIRGVPPNITCIGISTGLFSNNGSSTIK